MDGWMDDCPDFSLSFSHPVKVVEGGSELIELLLADALGITG